MQSIMELVISSLCSQRYWV